MPRLVGYARVLEIAAFDEPIPADQTLSWGLVTKVLEDGQALVEATAMAQLLARRALNSYAWTKKLITDAFNTSSESESLSDQINPLKINEINANRGVV